MTSITVTLAGFLRTRAGAPATFQLLVHRYRDDPRVTFLVWQNGPGGVTRRTASWLAAKGRC